MAMAHNYTNYMSCNYSSQIHTVPVVVVHFPTEEIYSINTLLIVFGQVDMLIVMETLEEGASEAKEVVIKFRLRGAEENLVVTTVAEMALNKK